MSDANFMYAVIGAVESMQNAVAKSQMENAITTSHASEVLKAALGEANDELTKMVDDMDGTSGYDFEQRNAEYQKAQQKWSSVETQLNTNVQVAQDMTTRDSQHQQSLVQFASVTNDIGKYVGGLVQSGY